MYLEKRNINNYIVLREQKSKPRRLVDQCFWAAVVIALGSHGASRALRFALLASLAFSDVKHQRSLIVFTNRASQRIGASRLDR